MYNCRRILFALLLTSVCSNARLSAAAEIENTKESLAKIEKACADGKSEKCAALVDFFLLGGRMADGSPKVVEIFENLCASERKREACEWPVETLACRRVGEFYASRHGAVEADPARALPALQRASGGGDAESTVQLARQFEATSEWDKAKALYESGCTQTSFLSEQCGVPAARLKQYAEWVTEACQRKDEAPEAREIRVAQAAADRNKVVTPPRALKTTPPRYPASARGTITGRVTLDMAIDETGKVTGATVTKGEEPFSSAAVECVKKWLYEPATQDGKAVATTMRTTVEFHKTR